MDKLQFVEKIFRIARTHGYKIEVNRSNLRQIDFGNKKLHEDHLANMYPKALDENANIANLIDGVARGRPCTHKPMKNILRALHEGAY